MFSFKKKNNQDKDDVSSPKPSNYDQDPNTVSKNDRILHNPSDNNPSDTDTADETPALIIHPVDDEAIRASLSKELKKQEAAHKKEEKKRKKKVKEADIADTNNAAPPTSAPLEPNETTASAAPAVPSTKPNQVVGGNTTTEISTLNLNNQFFKKKGKSTIQQTLDATEQAYNGFNKLRKRKKKLGASSSDEYKEFLEGEYNPGVRKYLLAVKTLALALRNALDVEAWQNLTLFTLLLHSAEKERRDPMLSKAGQFIIAIRTHIERIGKKMGDFDVYTSQINTIRLVLQKAADHCDEKILVQEHFHDEPNRIIKKAGSQSSLSSTETREQSEARIHRLLATALSQQSGKEHLDEQTANTIATAATELEAAVNAEKETVAVTKRATAALDAYTRSLRELLALLASFKKKLGYFKGEHLILSEEAPHADDNFFDDLLKPLRTFLSSNNIATDKPRATLDQQASHPNEEETRDDATLDHLLRIQDVILSESELDIGNTDIDTLLSELQQKQTTFSSNLTELEPLYQAYTTMMIAHNKLTDTISTLKNEIKINKSQLLDTIGKLPDLVPLEGESLNVPLINERLLNSYEIAKAAVTSYQHNYVQYVARNAEKKRLSQRISELRFEERLQETKESKQALLQYIQKTRHQLNKKQAQYDEIFQNYEAAIQSNNTLKMDTALDEVKKAISDYKTKRQKQLTANNFNGRLFRFFCLNTAKTQQKIHRAETLEEQITGLKSQLASEDNDTADRASAYRDNLRQVVLGLTALKNTLEGQKTDNNKTKNSLCRRALRFFGINKADQFEKALTVGGSKLDQRLQHDIYKSLQGAEAQKTEIDEILNKVEAANNIVTQSERPASLR